MPYTVLHTTAVQPSSHNQWYIRISKQLYQLPEFISANANSGLHSCISISIHKWEKTSQLLIVCILQVYTVREVLLFCCPWDICILLSVIQYFYALTRGTMFTTCLFICSCIHIYMHACLVEAFNSNGLPSAFSCPWNMCTVAHRYKYTINAAYDFAYSNKYNCLVCFICNYGFFNFT